MSNVTEGQVKYLVAMYQLKQKKPSIRSVELSRMLGVTRASVNGMVCTLSEAGLVEKERYGHITLTEKGEEMARSLYAGFCAAHNFFTAHLGLEPAQAWEAAMVFLATQKPECVQRLQEWMVQLSPTSCSAT